MPVGKTSFEVDTLGLNGGETVAYEFQAGFGCLDKVHDSIALSVQVLQHLFVEHAFLRQRRDLPLSCLHI